MKIKDLTVALACVNLLFVRGMDLKNTEENGSTTNSTGRIFFGRPANPLDFPFIVRLNIGNEFCGGSIIADQWVVTAAHCLYNQDCSITQIFPVAWEDARSVSALQCYVHAQYTNFRNAYDIALIKARANFLQDGRTRPIPLPPSGTRFPLGTPAVIAGWGQTENNQYPDRLLYGEFQVVDWNMCARIFGDCDPNSDNCIPHNLPAQTICLIGEGSSPAGTCYGDSGSPVMINGALSGLVSFGMIDAQDRCIVGTPSLQTNVVSHLSWIYSVTSS